MKSSYDERRKNMNREEKIENLKKNCKVRAWGCHSKYTGKCPLLGNGLDCHFEDLSDTALDECLQNLKNTRENLN